MNFNTKYEICYYLKLLIYPSKIIGKTVEVAYQAESIGRNGEPVLDFARFKSIRKDK